MRGPGCCMHALARGRSAAAACRLMPVIQAATKHWLHNDWQSMLCHRLLAARRAQKVPARPLAYRRAGKPGYSHAAVT